MTLEKALNQYFKDHPWPDPNILVRDPTTGKAGYVIGFDITDGACGFMEVFDEEAEDLSGEILHVEARHCKPVKENSHASNK